MLDSGQMYQMTPQTVVIVNGTPTPMTALAPGTPVMLQSAQPVYYSDGRYVVVTQPGSDPYEVSGVVRWVGSAEPGRSSLTLEGGRHIWIDESTQVLAGGVPVVMSTLRPGTFVVVRSTTPFAFRESDERRAVTASPSAMPGTVYTSDPNRAGTVTSYPYEMPTPIAPELGRRERESDRQSP
ncbi:MAG: hypothetical protein FJ027_10770 [Candidatus Rokubacteria bacterium]|nr:hypothetical protein [Candidatus Rokubacteria bacterium]